MAAMSSGVIRTTSITIAAKIVVFPTRFIAFSSLSLWSG
jgi:hypothetical protein